MINIDPADWEIVKNILSKYPYSFYAFGSRVKNSNKKFSDLDLCVMSNLSSLEMFYLNDEFEESNLPFKIDIKRYFADMDQNFRNLIYQDMTLIQVSPLFQKIEKNIFLNFKHLPKTIGRTVVEHEDLSMVSCGFSSLAFNIVCDTHLKDKSYENMVERTDEFYGKRPYVWWLGSPTIPNRFNLHLKSRGFVLFSVENAMVCDLTKKQDLPASLDLKIEQVTTMKHLEDFAKVLSAFESKIDTIYVNELLISQEFKEVNPLFIGYIDNKPIATVSLYIHDKLASLHDLATDEKLRNKGIGTRMVGHVMKYAMDKGIDKMCLTTSQDPGLSLYQRMGFDVVDKFECYLSHENYR